MNEQQNSKTHEVLKQSALVIQSLRRQLDEATRASREPIAVVGLACHFPGGCDSPEQYWSFLRGDRVGACDVPEDRWAIEEHYDPTPGKPYKMYLRQSNFIDRPVANFDARFFKISPAEANAMDPQQRLLLETCWEALENAGQRPDRLRGSDTGVFLGVNSNSEYLQLVKNENDVNEYLGTGSTSSIASGRISYVFGWNGPAVSLDTSCSSSLVSTQLAVDSLRRGDCEMALAGGVSMMLSAGVMASLCAMNALAPDGRSKPFDASADGYGRGEGCGIVVLKRLSAAIRDNDQVYATILGGAINNDGESSGLTIPNGRAQKAVLAKALENAGVEADAVDYVETHGTGTLLGDPIEIDAINHVYGRARETSKPMMLSAVKGNIGHAESAAGVASLIKAVLSLHHGTILPVTGLDELNPRVTPMSEPFDFPRSPQPYPPTPERRRYAAVSSFGFSGTNAHMILAEAPGTPNGVEQPEPVSSRPAHAASLLTATATDEAKLIRQIRQYLKYLDSNPDVLLEDVCYTANACRAEFTHRAVFLARSSDELVDSMRAVVRAHDESGSVYANTTELLGSSEGRDRYNAKRTLFSSYADGTAYTARTDEEIKPKLAFVLHGEPGETFSLARTFAKQFPVFQEALSEGLELFRDAYGDTVDGLIANDAKPGSPGVEQAWLFSAEYALCRLLDSYGVGPQIAFGERTGSLIAAWVAGVLSLEAAARLCVALDTVRDGEDVEFARVTLHDGQEMVDQALAASSGRVHLSATYSTSEWVLSGQPTDLEHATTALRDAGAKVVVPASETGRWPSAAYTDGAEAWRAAAEQETFQKPGLRYVSPNSLVASHKPDLLREDFGDNTLTAPVRFGDGLEALYQQGYRFFVELGGGGRRGMSVAKQLDHPDVVTINLTDADTPLDALLAGLAKLICLGSSVEWEDHYAWQARRKLMLPNYSFEQTKHWLATPDVEMIKLGERLASRITKHGLLGEPVNMPTKSKQTIYTFTRGNFPELLDNNGIVHVGYFLEMLKRFMTETHGEQPYTVRSMRFFSPIMVFESDVKEALLLLDPREAGGYDFEFHSKNAQDEVWNLNVSGTVASTVPAMSEGAGPIPRSELTGSGEGRVSGEDFYRTLEHRLALEFGPAVRWIDTAVSRETAAIVRLSEPEGLEGHDDHTLGFHPGVIDSCAQACNYVALSTTPEGTKHMVSEVDDVVLNPHVDARDLYAEVSMPGYDEDAAEISGSIRLTDRNGDIVASIGHIRLKQFDEKKLGELMVLMDESTLDKKGEDSDFLLRYANADVDRRHELVLGYLSALLATILEMDVDDIARDEPMRNYGLDSMTGLKFFRKTNQLLGVDITFADIAQVKDIWELTCALVEAMPGGSGVGVTQTKPYDEDLTSNHWIYDFTPREDAKVRLFCFPNGYRDADMFDGWREQLAPEIEVCPIVLPGMDTLRIHEKPPQDIDKFMDVLNEVLSPDLLDLPCATFGHSWGSLYSFRLAYRLSRNPMARLVKMFVSGYAAPIAKNPSIVKVLDELEKQGMTRIPSYDEVRGDSETMDAVVKTYMNAWGYEEDGTRATLPQLLTACRLIDRYTYDRDEKFAAPITAFEGVDDWIASDEIKLWDELTSGPFAIHTMAGDHQFINENQSEGRLMELFRDELFAVLPATAGVR